jgi:hypothetical protein
MTDRDSLTELFDQARSSDIEAVAGVKLFRVGRRLRGECPNCGASKGKKGGGAFSIEPENRIFYCFGCQAGGDVIALEKLLRGGSLKDAAERLVGAVVAPAGRREEPRPAPAPVSTEPTSAERIARELWRDAVPEIAGTLAETYLLGRGLSAEIVAAIGRRLRFHPAAMWGFDDDRRAWIRAPAMLARIVTPGGWTGGIHATYLAADGRGKARLDPAKRMWGRQVDGEGRPGGCWLTELHAKGPLVVGEGIESSLSAAQLQGRPCRVAAALSLGRLQGGWLTDNWGRIDPAAMTSDSEKPAFTWPDAGDVLVAVDRDMGGVEVKIRKLGGGTIRRQLTADERARICAGLAMQAWRRAGATSVRAIAPGAGRDFNVELQERRE